MGRPPRWISCYQRKPNSRVSYLEGGTLARPRSFTAPGNPATLNLYFQGLGSMQTRVEREGLPSSRPADLQSAEPSPLPVAIPVEPELIQRQRALLRNLFQLIA